MRKLVFILCVFISLPVYAVNTADLDKCREYVDENARAQCIQMYKRTVTRVELAGCKKDLNCWSQRYREQAEKYCTLAFERRAAGSRLWSKHWSGQHFDEVRWLDRGKGSMVFFEKTSAATLQCMFFPNVPSRVKVSLVPPG